MNLQKPGQVLYGNLDGEIIAYGNPQCPSAVAQKIEKMMDAIAFDSLIPLPPRNSTPSSCHRQWIDGAVSHSLFSFSYLSGRRTRYLRP